MKAAFVTTSHEGIASFRYRVASPARELAKRDIAVTVGNAADEDADVVLFSKHWTFNDWSYAKFCRARGQKVVFDICDDHFRSSKYADHYLRMVQVAHVLTVNSAMMREVVRSSTGRDSVVIGDPVLSPRMEYSKDKPLSLLWYGQPANLQGLFDVYTPELKFPIEVVVPAPLEPPEHFKGPQVRWTEWFPEVIERVAPRNSIAVLPYRQGKDAKSANRVLEAIQCGLPVITDSIPAVAPLLSPVVLNLADYDGLEAAVAALQTDLTEEMQKMQDYVQTWYSEETIANKWETLLRGLA